MSHPRPPFPGIIPLGLAMVLVTVVTGAAAASTVDVLDPDYDLIFQHITVNEGLPENSVRAMVQDRHGFVWLGTQNGLVRYDGYQMLVFTPVPGDSSSFGGRTVDALFEDSRGDIWIGTFLSGVWRYDGRRGGFHRVPLGAGGATVPLHVFDFAEDDSGTIWVGTQDGLASIEPDAEAVTWHPAVLDPGWPGRTAIVSAVLVDEQGRLWCGFEGHGLAVYHPATAQVERHLARAEDPEALVDDMVSDLFQDEHGRIWVATYGGLSLWHEHRRSFQDFVPYADDPNARGNVMTSLAMSADGVLWIGNALGLFAFDIDGLGFRLFSHDESRPASPVNGPVLCVLVDNAGVVWGGSWHTGLNKADPAAGRFRVTAFSLHEDDGRPAAVDAIFEDRRQRLWLGLSDKPHGSEDGRVLYREFPGGPWRNVPARARDGRPLRAIHNLLETRHGSILVGTFGGLWQHMGDALRPLTEVRSELPEFFDTVSVKDLVEDRQGRIWIAHWGGAYRWDPGSGEIRTYRHDEDDPRSLSSDGLTVILEDRQGRIWVGADSEGLNLYRPETDDFARYFDPQRGLGTVSDIHETPDGRLWLASFSGLVEFDPETGDTRVFGRRHGLPNDQMASILADAAGTLWISTGYGVASFDPATEEVRSFDTRDGLPDNAVMFGHLATGDGLLHFGGGDGLVSFDPTRFVFSDFVPPVVVTDIQVADRSLDPGPESPLAELPHLATGLRLPHDRNDLAFAFAALDFSRPDQNRFRFRLDGVDPGWRDPGRTQRAVYTDLRPGDYSFRVRASNHDGVWNDEGTTLAVTILPPWWQTGWARAAYVLLGLLLLWGLYRQLTLRERMRARLAMQKAEAEKLQEIDELKTRFLTNITHEFRTPLTLIKVPLQRLAGRLPEDDAENVATMQRNVDRLGDLIDQLLDLSRLEAGRLPLQWKRGDCLAFLRNFVVSFESLAAQRETTLEIEIAADSCEAWYDEDLLEKLAGNLLTNAVKHTPQGGRIAVTVAAGEPRTVRPRFLDTAEDDPPVQARELSIAVTNSGSYIPGSELERVFDRFHQASRVDGTGVGLSLVKELAQWLGGDVEVASDAETGTRFTATVPVFVDRPGGREDPQPDSDGAAAEAEEEDLAGGPRILVVEDNEDMRRFMARDLAGEYEVLEAADGEAGLALATEHIPDLVLSDVMMPGMDGFELCRRLKEDDRTSHVPVILLTARSEAESRREGLRLGADDYLAKPFDIEDLTIRIGNLIEQRRKLAQRYEQMLADLAPDALPVESADDRFLAQLRECVEARLDDAEFTVTDMCREVAMSRSQLHRKLTALTGKSARDFVRIHRLRRAAHLLDGGYGNVTEVAYAVGFRSLSYFSTAFREFHGVNPSEYLRESGGTNADDS